MLMEMYLREDGIKTKLTVKVPIIIRTDQFFLARGLMTNNTVKAKKSTQMALNTKVATSTERSLDWANTHGKTAAVLKAFGLTIRLKETEFICGQMEESILVIGKTI